MQFFYKTVDTPNRPPLVMVWLLQKIPNRATSVRVNRNCTALTTMLSNRNKRGIIKPEKARTIWGISFSPRPVEQKTELNAYT